MKLSEFLKLLPDDSHIHISFGKEWDPDAIWEGKLNEFPDLLRGLIQNGQIEIDPSEGKNNLDVYIVCTDFDDDL